MFVTRRRLQQFAKKAQQQTQQQQEGEQIDEIFKNTTRYRLHSNKESYVRESRFNDTRILGIPTLYKQYENEYHRILGDGDNPDLYTKRLLTANEVSDTPIRKTAKCLVFNKHCLVWANNEAQAKSITVVKPENKADFAPVTFSEKSQKLKNSKSLRRFTKKYVNMDMEFKQTGKGWYSNKPVFKENSMYSELPELSTDNHKYEFKHISGNKWYNQSSLKVEREGHRKVLKSDPGAVWYFGSTHLRRSMMSVFKHTGYQLFNTERTPRLSDQLMYYGETQMRVNPETIYMKMKSTPQISDQEATYGEYLKHYEKYYKRRSIVRKVVLFFIFIFFYSVTYGTLFLDNILTEEQLKDWQNYWRSLAFVGLVEKKVTEYKIEQVETEQKAAVERLEMNKIK